MRTAHGCGCLATAAAGRRAGRVRRARRQAARRAVAPRHPLRPPRAERPPTTATTTTSPIEVPVQIFLIDPTDHLVAVARDVSVQSPDLQAVLAALVAGPTDAESAAGLQTALPAQTTVIDATIAGGIATVNLGGTFGQLVGPPQIQAVAQVVFTASARPRRHRRHLRVLRPARRGPGGEWRRGPHRQHLTVRRPGPDPGRRSLRSAGTPRPSSPQRGRGAQSSWAWSDAAPFTDRRGALPHSRSRS